MSPAGGSIAQRAVRGSVWTLGGYAAGQLVRFVSNVILARLLFPEVFGLMALTFTFIQGLAMFSDVGIGPAIVQNPRGDEPRFLNTAWTIGVLRGLALWIASAAIALPIARIYEQPVLVWLVPVAGLTALLSGLESTSVHWLRRHLRLEWLTGVDFGCQVLGMVATIALAIVGRRLVGPNDLRLVWAPLGGNLVASVARVVVTHAFMPGPRNGFLIDRALAGAQLRFGRWVFVSTLLTFLASQSDRLLLARLVSMAEFGVFGIAATLASIPTLAIEKIGGAVAFPALSRMSDRTDFDQVFERARTPLLLAGAAAASALFACGPPLVGLLYDARYADAEWMVQYLAVGAWLQTLAGANGAALLALGRVNVLAATSAAKFAGIVLFFPLGFHFGGLRGALVGLALSDLARYAVSAWGVSRFGMRPLRSDAGQSALALGVALAGYGAARALRSGGGGQLVALMAAAAATGAVWAVLGLRYFREHRAHLAGG
jgi:O-antigen/teichoic acid export membrane protein